MKTEKQSPDREKTDKIDNPAPSEDAGSENALPATKSKAGEIGGRKGPDPTRFGDWELGGKCVDF